MIYKTFFNKHIDLSKIVSITDAYYIGSLYTSGGSSVGFDIHIQLLDSPMHYRRNFSIEEVERNDPIKVDGTTLRFEDCQCESETYDPDILAVHNLQKQIDVLVKVWKLWKDSENDITEKDLL